MSTDQLSDTFAALADPTRRAILARLAEGDATVNELAAPFPVSLPAISRHLKVLERAGLIARGRSAQSRPSSLRVEPLERANDWMETRRATWERRMDRLDRHLDEIRERTQAMTEQTPVEASPQDQQVAITRIFDAPRQTVFEAWTDPDQVSRWWGPDGFHTPAETVEIDLRVGGRYHLDMVQKQTGAHFPLRYEIIELVAPELIVLKGDPMPEMGIHQPTITRIELHDDGGKTRMTLTDGPYPVSGHAEQGWNASFDKLDKLLRPT